MSLAYLRIFWVEKGEEQEEKEENKRGRSYVYCVDSCQPFLIGWFEIFFWGGGGVMFFNGVDIIFGTN